MLLLVVVVVVLLLLLLLLPPLLLQHRQTISNGFAMGAVIGRREVMEPAADSFISTTYHTERIGPAAALATIKKMRSHNTIEHNCSLGRQIKAGWLAAAERTGVKISTSGIDPWPSFKFGAAPNACAWTRAQTHTAT